MIAKNTSIGPEIATVDAGALLDLTEKYTKYRQTMCRGTFDPVRVLHLTGDVLASVHEIINGRTALPETAHEEAPQ